MKKLIIIFLLLVKGLLASEDLNYIQVSSKVQAFVDNYCISCHNEDKKKASVRFDNLNSTLKNGTVALLWQDVLDILNTGEMPPEEAKKTPKDDELAEAIGLLTDDLVKARKVLNDQGGEVVIRRMNREEFINSIKFYTGVKVPSVMVPLDENSENEFDTLGSYQTFSPLTHEEYQKAAEFALQKVLLNVTQAKLKNTTSRFWGSDEAIKSFKQKKAELTKLIKLHKKANSLPFKARKLPRDEAATTAYFKKHGFKSKNIYKLALRPGFIVDQVKSYANSPLASKGKLLFNGTSRPKFREMKTPSKIVDTRANYKLRIKLFAETQIPESERYLNIPGVIESFKVSGTPNNAQIVEFTIQPKSPNLNIMLSTIFRSEAKYKKIRKELNRDPAFCIEWMELKGPYYSSNWQKHVQGILLDKNPTSLSNKDAQEIIWKFATRAYRGAELSNSFTEQLFKIYTDELKRDIPTYAALVKPLSIILSSPTFLYLNEDKSNKREERKNTLHPYEFANRLSYMLWKEPPADFLVKNGTRLMKDSIFRNQIIDKMVADKRFNKFIDNYFSQWLYLDKLDHVSFDKKKYPQFKDGTRHEAKKQVIAFMKYIVMKDLDLGNIIDSNFTMLNNLMATHYSDLNIPNKEKMSFEFSPVALSGTNKQRGGILGMAAIQAMGSTGERTSPVERGAWILRKLLNSPPPPPPPNVPQLEIDDKGLSTRTVLNKHKDIPQCKSCHKKMDDMGLAMEQFNLIGQWRSQENGKDIITAGEMPDGTKFSNFQDMKSKLMTHKNKMIEGMVEALIAFGLSRESEFSDQTFIENLVQECSKNEYKFKPLLKAFIGSKKFMEK